MVPWSSIPFMVQGPHYGLRFTAHVWADGPAFREHPATCRSGFMVRVGVFSSGFMLRVRVIQRPSHANELLIHDTRLPITCQGPCVAAVAPPAPRPARPP
jgi:hypothetical protein